MEKVIQSLQEGCNALLESPTGTGKTLCLLCATLAWRKSFGDFLTSPNQIQEKRRGSRTQRSNEEKGRFSGSQHENEEKGWFPGSQQSGSQSTENPRSSYPVIVYTSRTHSQLKQVIRELKTTNYRPRMSILGSREQMCIHDEVRLMRGRTQNNACRYLCKKRLCRSHTKVSEFMKNNPELGNEPFDIEDLVKIGRTKGPCPYYVSRELHLGVDILFAPYNYLIDPANLRSSLPGINWNNAVLIFDEAHNLEGICADAASFDLPAAYLSTCISEAKQCVDLCIKRRVIDKSSDGQHDPDNYAILRALLLKLEKRIAEITINSKEMGFTRPGHYIYEFLSDLNITYETANMLIETIDNAALLLEEENSIGSGLPIKSKGTVCRLESIRDILNIIFGNGDKGHAKFYRFHVQESKSSSIDSMKGKVSRILSWWCFNPGLAMQIFIKMGVRSILLTSGTLSPLDSFALEFNLEFPVRLENPHVISANQVWVGVVPSGPSGYSFNSSYKSRDSLEYKQDLGNAIVNFSRIVPDGLLVFFPSYYLMDQCIDCWKNMNHASSTVFSTIWERICKNKQPVIEPKQSALFPDAIEDFESKLRDTATSGAIFFAVCRGKVSEGLDFADQAGRAVIITGIPFSMKTDPKVRLKREYLDQQAFSQKDSKALTGENWYVQQAARAVNQAMGRVIRHSYDYGAIIVCDERFAQQNWQCQMSYWLRPHIKCYPKFGDVVFTLTKFFKDRASCIPLNPKRAVNLISEKAVVARNQILSSKSPFLASDSEQCSSKPSSSILAVPGGRTVIQLGHIIPANRSNLSNNQIFSFTRQRSQDWSQNTLQTTESTRGSTQHQENDIIDLTSDNPHHEQGGVDFNASCSAKRPKVLKLHSDGGKCHFSSSMQLCKADLRRSPPKTSVDSSLGICCKQPSLLSACESVDFRRYDEDRGTQCGQVGSVMMSKHEIDKVTALPPKNKEDVQSSSLPCGDTTAKGSAFLLQVQEKLTPDEYTEFVSLMKALKSKTMKITVVLERIAILFSGPQRFLLLKGFKDFVPAKYRPMYEHHL